LRDLFNFSPNPKQITTPQLSDLFLGVAAPNQLQCDVECFRRAVPAENSATAIEVGRNSNVIDSNKLHRVVDMIREILHGGSTRRRQLYVNRSQPVVVFGAPFR
jgi:hypothetical protein